MRAALGLMVRYGAEHGGKRVAPNARIPTMSRQLVITGYEAQDDAFALVDSHRRFVV
jgi:hypothetical protein